MQDGQEELLTGAAPALVAEALERFGSIRLQVTGSSMLPTIRPRDIVVVERRRIADVQIADVVLFAVEGRLFVHRVVGAALDETGALSLETKGDTHRLADRPILSHQLLGEVVTVWRDGRERPAPFPYSRAASVAALFAARGLRLASKMGVR